MNYAKWSTLDEMINNVPLNKINNESKINKVSLPIAYDEDNIYTIERGGHNIVIGSTGSGKTQTITLPMLELALRSGESVVIHDTKSELYDMTHDKFEKKGYKVIRLNFDDAQETSSWNPFALPLKLYKEGNKDKAEDLIEEIAYYLLYDRENNNSDPFWINSAMNYFIGITLYAFEKNDEVTLDNILKIDRSIRDNDKTIIEDIAKYRSAYINLSGIIESPGETRGSIISVFSQKIKRYASRENLRNMLSKTDFDLEDISKNKTIIYIISGNSNNSEYLLPLFVSEIYYAKDEYSKDNSKINIILDDFFRLNKIRNFSKILTYSRSIYITFTIMLRGYNDISNVYDKEETEIIKLNFANTIYILSQDLETLKELSNMCGLKNDSTPLITVEELKTMKQFEAIVLTIRQMPFKTKLLPYYKMKI